MKIKIASFLEASTVDYPGKISSVIWTPGCPFRCPFCQNAELLIGNEFELVEEEDLFQKIIRNNDFIDALTITGGEPTLHSESLIPLIKKLKQNKILIQINTNGFYPDNLKKMIPYLDYVSIDVKNDFDPELYGKTINNQELSESAILNLKKSLELLKNSKVFVEARTTIVPGLNDNKKIVEEISKIIKWTDLFVLRKFRNTTVLDPEYKKLDSPSDKLMAELKVSAEKYHKRVVVKS